MTFLNSDQAIDVLKQVVNASIQKGLFATMEDVNAVSNALQLVAGECQELKKLKTQVATASEKV